MTAMASDGRGLSDIRSFVIETTVLRETVAFLQEVGSQGYEGFVLWAGTRIDRLTFRFSRSIVPPQKGLMTENGLLVFVEGAALFGVNKMLYETGQTLGGQVHTHPTSAYHSSTDDHYPLVTLVGALSVVIPDFAVNAPGDIALWAWYRLIEYGQWKLATQDTEVFIE